MIAIRPCDPLCDLFVRGGKRLFVYVLILLFDDDLLLLLSTSDHFVGREEEEEEVDDRDVISLIVDIDVGGLLLINDTTCG